MSRSSLERAIPEGHRILLDSNTLIAYLDQRDPVSLVATHVVDLFVQSGRNQALVSMVTVMEVLVRPLRSRVREPYQHLLDLLTRFPNLQLGVIDLAVAQEAASLRASYNLRAADAMIVGTGLIHQVGHLVTNDADWSNRLRPLAQRIRVCHLTDHLPFD